VGALYLGFQQFRQMTPRARVKALRLARVHADLRAANPASTLVTDIALKWGFVNLGHFAKAYKNRFGRSPSETLCL
jgi:transcriptional regulator GlxA family with amidase domain